MIKLLSSPSKTLVLMTGRAWVRDLIFRGHNRRDKSEGVAANVHVGKRLLDWRHVAGNTFSAGATGLVMRVFFDLRGMRTVGRAWPVTFQAHDVGWFNQ